VPPEEEKSRIDQLNESLYSRNAPDVRTRRRMHVDGINSNMQTEWERPAEQEHFEEVERGGHKDYSMSFLTKLLIGSMLFCIIAVGIGTYLFLNGSNLISANNINVAITGPVSIPGGSPVSFDIVVTNNNTVDLQQAGMTVTFPPGATSVADPTQQLSTYQESLGTIPAGKNVKKTVAATIFGEENIQKTIIVDVEYTVKGSTSPFTKEQTYDVLMNSSPVTLTVSSFKEISSGQEFDITFDIKSNSTDTLKNILLAATYPFGFTYLSSSQQPLPNKMTWRLGDIPPGGDRKVTVHGKLTGEDQDTKVFHGSVGSASATNPNAVGTEFTSAEQDIALQKSFMTMAVVLDNNQGAGDASGKFNQPVQVAISWLNNLPTTISNAEIDVNLSGSAYDRTLVQPSSGYYQSSSDQIIWNSQNTPSLSSVAAGQGGNVSFTITPRDLSTPGRPVVNPTLTFTVNVKGNRTQETGVPSNLSAIIVRNDRISSSASLSGTVLRSGTVFTNSGPVPPRADQKTTYVIEWSIENTANVLDKAQVTATLPPYVSWLKQASPSTEDVSYDPKSGTVTWNAGTVGTYTANSGQRKTVSFQVSLEPNVNQVGSVPTLVNDAALTATDDFTAATLTSKQSYLTTRYSTDPSYKPGDETVAQ